MTTIDDEAYAYLSVLCEKTPKELRGVAYDHRPESLEGLRRWGRRDLIPFLFDVWLKKREERRKEASA